MVSGKLKMENYFKIKKLDSRAPHENDGVNGDITSPEFLSSVVAKKFFPLRPERVILGAPHENDGV